MRAASITTRGAVPAASIQGRPLFKGGFYYKFTKKLREISAKNAHFLAKLMSLALKQIGCGYYLRAAYITSLAIVTAASNQGRPLLKGGF